MTDPVTRAKAAMIRVVNAWEQDHHSPLGIIGLCEKELVQEIEQAVMVERKRCAEIVRSYWSASVLMSLNEQQRMINDMAEDIEGGVENDRDPASG